MKKNIDKKESYELCYQCGIKEYGIPPEEDMEGITVWEGTCPVCGMDKTLIPRCDFYGQGD
jgi:hypothetical protein